MREKMENGKVIGLSKSGTHTFHKYNCEKLVLREGFGVKGDAHAGETVKHRSRVAKDPTQPNLRQVHLIHFELFDELAGKGFAISPGQMGENITTQGIPLLDLPRGTKLIIGGGAEIVITGLRNPCVQLESIQEGLMKAVLDKDADGELIRKAGIMGIVSKGGEIFVGDQIVIELPEPPFSKLEKV